MGFFAARDAETSLKCPKCGGNLHIARTCHEVYIICPACRARYELKDHIGQADQAMESFLENVYCDRM